MRIYETLRFGPPEAPVEITLTRSGGSTLDNVGRWAAQVGLPQPKVEELPKVTVGRREAPCSLSSATSSVAS